MAESAKKKILIGEDERPMAKALHLKLTNAGYDVHNVYDGDEAVQALDADTYDMVLLDIVMPRRDGFAVLEHMKEKKMKLPPVFVLSNLSQEEDSKKAIELGAKEFIIKSNTPINDVVAKVKSYL